MDRVLETGIPLDIDPGRTVQELLTFAEQARQWQPAQETEDRRVRCYQPLDCWTALLHLGPAAGLQRPAGVGGPEVAQGGGMVAVDRF